MVQQHKITIAPIALMTAENARKLYCARSKVGAAFSSDNHKSGYFVRGAVGRSADNCIVGIGWSSYNWVKNRGNYF